MIFYGFGRSFIIRDRLGIIEKVYDKSIDYLIIRIICQTVFDIRKYSRKLKKLKNENNQENIEEIYKKLQHNKYWLVTDGLDNLKTLGYKFNSDKFIDWIENDCLKEFEYER